MSNKSQNSFILRHVTENINFIIDSTERKETYKEPLCINDMGAEIFMLLQEGNTRGQIMKQLLSEYDAKESVILEDLNAFIRQLTKFGYKF